MDLNFDNDLVTCSYVLSSPNFKQTRAGCHNTDQPLGCLRVYEEMKPAPTATVG